MLNARRFAGLALLIALSLAVAGVSPSVEAQRGPAISPDLFGGLSWRCIGPFDGGPVSSVTGESGVPGVYVITTPSGGSWKTIDGGDTWTPFVPTLRSGLAGDPHRWIDPANLRRIVRTEPQGSEVSLDGGQTWMASQHLPIAEVARLTPRALQREPAGHRTVAGKAATVSIADPARPGLVFAGT